MSNSDEEEMAFRFFSFNRFTALRRRLSDIWILCFEFEAFFSFINSFNKLEIPFNQI